MPACKMEMSGDGAKNGVASVAVVVVVFIGVDVLNGQYREIRPREVERIGRSPNSTLPRKSYSLWVGELERGLRKVTANYDYDD